MGDFWTEVVSVFEKSKEMKVVAATIKSYINKPTLLAEGQMHKKHSYQ